MVSVLGCEFDNCAISVWGLHHTDSGRIFHLRVMGVGPSGWSVGAYVYVLLHKGELGGRAINRYSCACHIDSVDVSFNTRVMGVGLPDGVLERMSTCCHTHQREQGYSGHCVVVVDKRVVNHY